MKIQESRNAKIHEDYNSTNLLNNVGLILLRTRVANRKCYKNFHNNLQSNFNFFDFKI